MSLIVQKFGGSSVSDNEGIYNAARLIAKAYKNGDDVIAVVSAQGNTTDVLIEKALEISKKAPKRELDVIMSVGEQISVSLLSIALNELSVPSVSLLGWQAGIRSNSDHGYARIRDINTDRIKKELANKKAVIIAGFQGIDKNGDMTTFGRGGSDTTAVAIAAAMNAEKCQVFSKTDGIYTADPFCVPEAQKLSEISYDEMQELAFLGVKVLNPRAVELAKKYGVIIEVKSAFDNSEGTLVKEIENVEKMLINGVTKNSNTAKITVTYLEDSPAIAFKIFGLLAKNGINTDIILQSSHRNGKIDIAFTVSEENADYAAELLYENGFDKDNVTCDKNVTKVSVVGAGMESHPGVTSSVFEALSAENINILMMSSSELRISVVVKADRADEAVSAIHKKFVNI